MEIHIYFDGACHNIKGQDCPMGCGVHVQDEKGKTVAEIAFSPVCYGSSNVAEWIALMKACEYLETIYNKQDTFVIFGDSQLIVNQISGRWIASEQFERYRVFCDFILKGKRNTKVLWIRRAFNQKADVLSKNALKIAKQLLLG